MCIDRDFSEFENNFAYACPKFLSPVPPNYDVMSPELFKVCDLLNSYNYTYNDWLLAAIDGIKLFNNYDSYMIYLMWLSRSHTSSSCVCSWMRSFNNRCYLQYAGTA